jgi:menaquinone-dependent protoporphyrinogen oxidase
VFAGVTSLFILLSIGFGAAALGRRFRLYSIATLAALVVFGTLTFLDAPRIGANLPTPWLGLIERLNLGTYLLWVVVLSVGLLRAKPAAEAKRVAPGSIAVLYATREGQTRKIATRFGDDLRARGLAVEVHDLRDGQVSIEGATAVVLAASIHIGKHEKEMVAFVRAHRDELARVPTLFLSVSLSEAGAEMRDRPPAVRAKASAEVHAVAEKFFVATGFRPTHLLPVAGALAYRHYNVLVRFIMKKIAAAEGASTDTSREHEYTDWAILDATAESFARELR